MEKNIRYLDKEYIKLHINEKKKQDYTSKKYDTFFDGRVLQICFYSIGCRFSKNGSCIMCDYGAKRRKNISSEDVKKIINEATLNLSIKPEILLLNSLGSILDIQEMPIENINTLLEEVSKIDIEVIIFETHYLTINKKILRLIKEKMPNKNIVIELGLESANKDVREKCLNKFIDNNKFVEKIQLIQSFGFKVETNVIFGTPFLTKVQQMKDAVSSIDWCFNNNISIVNLFPINIKPYTLLYKLYESGEYRPFFHNDFIKVLDKIPYKYIDKIHLCWYGNRKTVYEGMESVTPICKKSDYDSIMEFYEEFNKHKDKKYRKKLLRNIRLKLKI